MNSIVDRNSSLVERFGLLEAQSRGFGKVKAWVVLGIGNHGRVVEEVLSGVSEVGVLIEADVSEQHPDVIQVEGLNLLDNVVLFIHPHTVESYGLRMNQLEDQFPLSWEALTLGNMDEPELGPGLGDSLPEVEPGNRDQVSGLALEFELIQNSLGRRSLLVLEVLGIGIWVEESLLVIEDCIILENTHGGGCFQNNE